MGFLGKLASYKQKIICLTIVLMLFLFAVSCSVKEDTTPSMASSQNIDLQYSSETMENSETSLILNDTKTLEAELYEGSSMYKFTANFTLEENAHNYNVSIDVMREDEYIQTLEFAVFGFGVDELYSEVIPRWKIIDYNFDGYKDVLCYASRGGNTGVQKYQGWSFNPETELFDKIIGIDEIPNLQIDFDLQALRGYGWSGGIHEYSIFGFIGNTFVETNSLSINYNAGVAYDPDTNELRYNYIDVKDNGERAKITAMELRNGELVDIFPDLICGDEAGRAMIGEYVYGTDSIWFSPEGIIETNGSAYSLIEKNSENENWE